MSTSTDADLSRLPPWVQERFHRFLTYDALPPAHRNMGVRPDLWLKEAEVGRVLYRWPNDGSRDIAPGRVYGGWISGLSDNIVSLCMATALEEGENFTTLDLQVKIFRPVGPGEIEIEAWVRNRSRTTGYVEADWRLPNGKLAARVLTWKAIRPAETLAPRG
jgi:acyl-coenzyme A thioesterase PaaI-like protein